MVIPVFRTDTEIDKSYAIAVGTFKMNGRHLFTFHLLKVFFGGGSPILVVDDMIPGFRRRMYKQDYERVPPDHPEAS